MADKTEYEPVDTGEGKKKVKVRRKFCERFLCNPELQIEKMEEEEAVGLKASLGLIQGCTIIVGSIIGSGIFIAPGGVLKQTGSVNMSLTVWILSGLSTLLSPVIENTMSLYLMPGLYSMIGAYCYAELGLLIRKVSIDSDSL